jgi:hypothetical protein
MGAPIDPERRRYPPLARPSGNTRHEDALFAVFVLGVVLFSPLVIGIFDRGADATVLGVPLLFAFLFTAWAALVCLVAIIVNGAPDRPDVDTDTHRESSYGG